MQIFSNLADAIGSSIIAFLFLWIVWVAVRFLLAEQTLDKDREYNDKVALSFSILFAFAVFLLRIS